MIYFFNDTATTEIYTLSLHDALPILQHDGRTMLRGRAEPRVYLGGRPHIEPACRILDDERLLRARRQDRKSTRLNSSHPSISYAVFCLKKKKLERITS